MKMPISCRLVVFAGLCAWLVSGCSVSTESSKFPPLYRASVASDGTGGDGNSSSIAVSVDGRYIAFASTSTNLVANDTNGLSDIFLHDSHTRTTRRVSVATDGSQANSASISPAISADGRYVVFASHASNLVTGDNNGSLDVFLHDSQTQLTSRLSLASDGGESDGSSFGPRINADGRYIVFHSTAANLVANDTNGVVDVFLYDTLMQTTSRISLANNGSEGNQDSTYPAISANGRYIAFVSVASNLVAGDDNGVHDVFLHDALTQSTVRVSLADDGTEADALSYDAEISASGRYIAFRSAASNLVSVDTDNITDAFLYDTQDSHVIRVAQGTNRISVDAEGRYVVYEIGGIIYVRNPSTGAKTVLSVNANGTPGDRNSYSPTISADGRYVIFESTATNFAPNDTSYTRDVFRAVNR